VLSWRTGKAQLRITIIVAVCACVSRLTALARVVTYVQVAFVFSKLQLSGHCLLVAE